jgi:hypothetical protein
MDKKKESLPSIRKSKDLPSVQSNVPKTQVTDPTEYVTFFERLLIRLDFIPTFTATRVISFNEKFLHTIIGFTLLVLFQLIPLAGFYYIVNTYEFSFVFSKQKNLTTLARHAILAAPLCMEIIFKFILKGKVSSKNYDRVSRGVRNLAILTGILLRNNYLMYYRELGQTCVSLFENQYLGLAFLVFNIENLLAALGLIWLDEYLENYSLSGRHNLSYYQLSEMLIIFYMSPAVGGLTILNLVYTLMIVLSNILQDFYFTQRIPIEHIQAKGVSKIQTIKPSTVRTNSIFVYSMLKNAFYGFFDLIVNPLLRNLYALLAYYKWPLYTIKLQPYLGIPEAFFECPIFTEEWELLPFMKSWDNYTAQVLFAWLSLESLILVPLVTYFSDYFIPDLRAEVFAKRLKNNNMRIKNENAQYSFMVSYLNKKLRKVISLSVLLSAIFTFVSPLLPIYGTVLKSSTINYLYGRVESISDNIKQIPKEQKKTLPKFIRPIIDLIQKV